MKQIDTCLCGIYRGDCDYHADMLNLPRDPSSLEELRQRMNEACDSIVLKPSWEIETEYSTKTAYHSDIRLPLNL